MDASNWINLGLLIATILFGIIAIVQSRSSAKDAALSQDQSSRSANRAALALEETTRYHRALVDIEQKRDSDKELSAKQATLRARVVTRTAFRNGGNRTEQYLTITNLAFSAPAKNVKILINGKPIAEFPECKTPYIENSTIDSQSEMEFLLKRPGTNLPNTFQIKLIWDDGIQLNNEFESQLTW